MYLICTQIHTQGRILTCTSAQTSSFVADINGSIRYTILDLRTKYKDNEHKILNDVPILGRWGKLWMKLKNLAPHTISVEWKYQKLLEKGGWMYVKRFYVIWIYIYMHKCECANICEVTSIDILFEVFCVMFSLYLVTSMCTHVLHKNCLVAYPLDVKSSLMNNSQNLYRFSNHKDRSLSERDS